MNLILCNGWATDDYGIFKSVVDEIILDNYFNVEKILSYYKDIFCENYAIDYNLSYQAYSILDSSIEQKGICSVNKTMLEHADFLIKFWDGETEKNKDDIDSMAISFGIHAFIYNLSTKNIEELQNYEILST